LRASLDNITSWDVYTGVENPDYAVDDVWHKPTNRKD